MRSSFVKNEELAGFKVDDSLLRGPANFLIAKTKILSSFSPIDEAVNYFFVFSPLDLQEECRKKNSNRSREERKSGKLRAALCK
jgi:hypothetical protein